MVSSLCSPASSAAIELASGDRCRSRRQRRAGGRPLTRMQVVSLPCQALLPFETAAATLPEAADERERHDRTGDRDERRAAPVGVAARLAGEADAEADDRIVG